MWWIGIDPRDFNLDATQTPSYLVESLRGKQRLMQILVRKMVGLIPELVGSHLEFFLFNAREGFVRRLLTDRRHSQTDFHSGQVFKHAVFHTHITDGQGGSFQFQLC